MKKKEGDDQIHQEIKDLLPWYVNETLSAAERERVAAHLVECSACLAELETLQVLRSVVRDSNERLPPPSDDQLANLLARIEKSETDSTRRKIRAPVARLKEWWVSLPALARAVMLAQAVTVIVLAFASIALVRRVDRWEAAAVEERLRADRNESLLAREKKRAAEYQSLSGSPEEGGGTAVKFTVAFREDATVKEMRDFLRSIDAKVVSGPSPLGYYDVLISVPPGANAQSFKNDTLARLRSRRDVVRLAELFP